MTMITDIASGVVFNLCSETNSWIDILVWCDDEDVEKAKEVSEKALGTWHEDDAGRAFGDYLDGEFKKNGINAYIYWLQD